MGTEGAPATVGAVAFGGPFTEVKLLGGSQTLRLRIAGPAPSIGEAVRVTFNAARARIYPRA